jgi:hypothetical protein
MKANITRVNQEGDTPLMSLCRYGKHRLDDGILYTHMSPHYILFIALSDFVFIYHITYLNG